MKLRSTLPGMSQTAILNFSTQLMGRHCNRRDIQKTVLDLKSLCHLTMVYAKNIQYNLARRATLRKINPCPSK